MPIDTQTLLNWNIPEVEQQYSRRDTMLYALGVGLGSDPCDVNQLKFVYEAKLEALPTMATILAYPGPWHTRGNTGVTPGTTVHGEQGFEILNPLPVEGTVVGKTRVTGVIDKGKGKGALIYTECLVRDKATGTSLCKLNATTFCRVDGGFDGPTGPTRPLATLPERSPDVVCDLPTLPQAALIYRLSGDYNPLHADPAFARKARFDRPIYHGRGIFGVAGHALLKTCCDYNAARLRSMECRFSSPVYPGETIRTEMWRDGSLVFFRSTVPARGVTVASNGRAEIVG